MRKITELSREEFLSRGNPNADRKTIVVGKIGSDMVRQILGGFAPTKFTKPQPQVTVSHEQAATG